MWSCERRRCSSSRVAHAHARSYLESRERISSFSSVSGDFLISTIQISKSVDRRPWTMDYRQTSPIFRPLGLLVNSRFLSTLARKTVPKFFSTILARSPGLFVSKKDTINEQNPRRSQHDQRRFYFNLVSVRKPPAGPTPKLLFSFGYVGVISRKRF